MATKFLPLILFFCTSASTIDLNCQFNFHKFTTISAQYTCFVKNDIKILDSSTKIDNIIGIHDDHQSINSVTALTIENADVHFIPSNLAELLPNLLALTIKNGQLKELHQNDLKSLTKLKYLNLDGNLIEVLDDGLFEFNPELQLIWFFNNKIKKIGSSVFINLKNLLSLDLSKNACISKKYANYKRMNINGGVSIQQVPLSPAIFAEISQKCSAIQVETTPKIETTTTKSQEQIYRENITNLESRLLEVMMANKKSSEELIKAKNQLNISKIESENAKKIFRLELDLKIATAKTALLERKLTQKNQELTSMTDDLSKAHESIERFEAVIALNYAPLRSADRAEISKLKAEKADLRRKIGDLLEVINQLKVNSETEIQKSKLEVEELRAKLFKDETQEVDVGIDEGGLDESESIVKTGDEELEIDDSSNTEDPMATETAFSDHSSTSETTFELEIEDSSSVVTELEDLTDSKAGTENYLTFSELSETESTEAATISEDFDDKILEGSAKKSQQNLNTEGGTAVDDSFVIVL